LGLILCLLTKVPLALPTSIRYGLMAPLTSRNCSAACCLLHDSCAATMSDNCTRTRTRRTYAL
jgi:hypothetical protein